MGTVPWIVGAINALTTRARRSSSVELETWQRTLVELQLLGLLPEQAASMVVAEGVSPRQIETFSREVASDPLLRIARTYRIRLACREWMDRARRTVDGTIASGLVIDERGELSREEFLAEYYVPNRAVILRGVASRWPAIARWTKEYFIDTCGDVEVEVMSGRTDAAPPQQNTSRTLARSLAMREYVTMIWGAGETNDIYLVSRNRFFEREGTKVLLDDLRALPFVNTHAANGGVKMWLGPSGTVTKLHHDDRNNVIIQIIGRKQIRLYPPYYAELTEQTEAWYANRDPEGIPGSQSGSRPRVGTEFILEPGDGLFIPVGWWHALKAVGVSATLAFVDFGLPNDYGKPY